jgi:hypothetical protein
LTVAAVTPGSFLIVCSFSQTQAEQRIPSRISAASRVPAGASRTNDAWKTGSS